MAKQWYVVHTYSGFEKKVRETILGRIQAETDELKDLFGEVLIPAETVVEMKKGRKRTGTRSFFPGYILIEIDLGKGESNGSHDDKDIFDRAWHLVRDTPKVTGFVGGKDPAPIPDADVQDIRNQMAEGVRKPKPRITFNEGENVRVVDGPFSNFSGIVDSIKLDKGKVVVLVSIFGRQTPVELDFAQVEKS